MRQMDEDMQLQVMLEEIATFDDERENLINEYRREQSFTLETDGIQFVIDFIKAIVLNNEPILAALIGSKLQQEGLEMKKCGSVTFDEAKVIYRILDQFAKGNKVAADKEDLDDKFEDDLNAKKMRLNRKLRI